MPFLFFRRNPFIVPTQLPNRMQSALSVVLAIIALGAASASAQRIAPDESWRTLDTEHFRVTFPAHLEDLARRAADRAEWAHGQLSEQFIAAPRGIIDLVLTDHIDASNGFASPLPSNRITIFARPPIDSFGLAYFNDRLENIIVHELTHIFHIDRAGRYGFFRKLFGRVPIFPAISTPLWNIEGIATWYESALTGTGRVRGTFHNMVLRTAALEGRFESIGQAGGYSAQWPGGTRPYAYGSLFFEHLIQKYGRDRMIAFVKAIEKQWIPYRLDAAGRSAFGATLTNEWKAWADTQRAEAAELDTRLAKFGAITEPQVLTRAARYALHPQVSPNGKTLYYIRSDGRSDTQLISAQLDGGRASTVALVSGNTFAFAPNGDIVFAQLDFAGPHRKFSDLYRVTPGSDVRRITTRARLTAPSVGPTGWAVAVAEGGGSNGLARVNLSNGAIEMLVPLDPDIYWAHPTISPNAQWIAATRWARGRHDIVLLDARGNLVREVTRDRALDFAPTWSANGQWLVWASDRNGISNILAAKVEGGQVSPPVMLTNLRTGAAYPSVDPSGHWLYFSDYHVDGWEIGRIPFNPSAAPRATGMIHEGHEGTRRGRDEGDGPRAIGMIHEGHEGTRRGQDEGDRPRAIGMIHEGHEGDGPRATGMIHEGHEGTRRGRDEGDRPRAIGMIHEGHEGTRRGQDEGDRPHATGMIHEGHEGTRRGQDEGDRPRATGMIHEGHEGTRRGQDEGEEGHEGEKGDGTGATVQGRQARQAASQDRPRAYAPIETLRPYYWIPTWNAPIAVPAHRKGEIEILRTRVLGPSIGGRTSGIDLVRRHRYAVGTRIFLPVRSSSRGRAAGHLSYRYYGLGNPALGFSLSQNWDADGTELYAERADAPIDTFFVLQRSRRAAVSMTLVRAKVRSKMALTISGGLIRESREVLDAALRTTDRFRLDNPSTTLGEVSVGFSATTARSYALQMGAVTGTSFSVRVRRRRDLSNNRSIDDIRGAVRTYARLPNWLPARGFAAPVLALRASAGASRGPHNFDIGGAEGIPFPTRGYQTSVRSGRHAWSASLEYRAPLAWVNRGLRAWAIHCDRIFGTLFADAANTWHSSQSRPLLSAGTEVLADGAALYSAIRLRIGLAYRFTDPRGMGYYVRIGTSF